MKAEQLLQHFQRISEAPDAIPRLRCLILDLAVRGKLVEQDPSDEPAGLLLGRLKLDKQLAFQAEGIRARQAVAKVNREEMWFDFPPSWEYAPFDDVFVIASGVTRGQRVAATEATEVPYLRVANVQRGYLDLAVIKTITVKQSDANRYSLRSGDILMTEGGDWDKLGRAAIWGEQIQPCIHQNHIFRVRPPSQDILPKWVTTYVNSRLGRSFFEKASKQTTNLASINMTQLRGFPIPLPPLAEQHHIVAKVDELMSLCDQLEEAKEEREQCHDSLVAACLQGLNQPAEEEETFLEHARFTFNNLPRITTRAAHIKQLRQTILNLAVRGKLVPQDPSDEPARQWMSSYSDGQSGKGPRACTTSKETPIDNFEAGYKLPAAWLWIELGKVVVTMDSGWSPQCENHVRSDQSRWGVLKTTSVQPLAYDCRQNKELPAKLEARPQYEAIVGDILITRAGPKNRVGVSCVVHQTEPRLMISDKLIRFRLAEGLSPFFYALALNAGITSMAIEEAKSGMAVMQMNITQSKLRAVPVPLPPLAEQQRIVAKVNELLAICDQLEAQITVTEQDSRRFLESVLADALAPGIDLSAEAQLA